MRAVISGVAVGLLTVAVMTSPVSGQPAPAKPDFSRATELYKSATAAMTEGRFADAARDFGGAYDITKDALLFFKIGAANEKAGKCSVALIYYGRYIREAKPAAKFVDMTRERIAACGGDSTAVVVPATNPDAPAGSGSATVPPAGSGSQTGSAAPVVVPPQPVPPLAVLPSQPVATEDHGHGRDGAWLMVGGSLAFITAGAVLAYSASSSEQDLRDLYAGVTPPTFDQKTAQRYHDLIDEGHRYQYLSWASFGIAGACAIGAVVLFVRGGHEDEEKLSIRPIVTPHETGVAATVRF
ncbi:MAG: repeat-containing protein [Myxococcales bacterium]|nr:repeat-containing protein [Myxococcales bacterium]